MGKKIVIKDTSKIEPTKETEAQRKERVKNEAGRYRPRVQPTKKFKNEHDRKTSKNNLKEIQKQIRKSKEIE